MTFLYWVLFIIDILFAILIMTGSGFRSSFGAGTDLNSILLIGLVVIMIASLVLRFVFKMPVASFVVAASPMLGMFIWYLYDKNQK